jgi:hypothetical protein
MLGGLAGNLERKYILGQKSDKKNDIASYWIQETKEISAMIVGLIKSKKSEL